MFKLRPLVHTSRLVLSRRGLDKCGEACFSRTTYLAQKKQWQERETCPPLPPPPPDPPKDTRLLFGMMALAAISGCLAVYAKRDPEFRDWMSIFAPWFDDFVAIVYQENMTFEELFQYSVDNVKELISPKRKKPRQCSTDGTPIPPCDKDGDNRKRVECPPDEPKPVKEGETPPCVIQEPPVVTKNICELEGCIKDQADVAIHSYMTARDACKYYNELVVATVSDITPANLRELIAAKEERIGLVEEHVPNADAAAQNLDALTRYMDCGTTAPKDQVENIKRLHLELQIKTKRIRLEYMWANEIALSLDNQITMVSDLVTKFIKEMQAMFSSVKFESPKPQITEDPDLLFIHCKKYFVSLREGLLEEAAKMNARIDRGYEALPPPKDDKEKKEREKKLADSLYKAKAELEKWYQKRKDVSKKECDRLAECALRKQKEQLQRILDIKLKQKENMITVDLDRLLKEKVEIETKKFDRDLAEMAKKVKAAEDNLEEHLKAEREARKSQDLWAAGATLLAATKKVGKRVKINKELEALKKIAGKDDKLVNSVLSAIPEKIYKDGVVPWSTLRERYYGMEEVARKVALVEQEGAHMGVYIISYIQSLFLFMRLNGIPEEDIKTPIRKNMEDLDTFDILQRSRYWIQQDNLAAAVAYVDALKGASRGAAVSWYTDAQALLEVRQAAEAILAHATALSLHLKKSRSKL